MDWLRRRFRRDPALRLRCAWHVLRGRPLAYRLDAAPTLRTTTGHGWIVQSRVDLRRPPTPDIGIVVGGRNAKIIGGVVEG